MKTLEQIIDTSNNIVFFCGAGVSVASGIPDFRSATGLYTQNLSAETILSATYFHRFTKEFYEFYFHHMVYRAAKPNKAHLAMANLEKLGKCKAVITQNIDGLHQNAGSKNVYELHGTIHSNTCMNCHKHYDLEETINHIKNGIPTCECLGIIKPDVVLYEESLNEHTIQKSIEAIASCDTLIVAGTSLSVYPAAGFIRYFNGHNLVLINKSETSYDKLATLIIRENVEDVLAKYSK